MGGGGCINLQSVSVSLLLQSTGQGGAQGSPGSRAREIDVLIISRWEDLHGHSGKGMDIRRNNIKDRGVLATNLPHRGFRS